MNNIKKGFQFQKLKENFKFIKDKKDNIDSYNYIDKVLRTKPNYNIVRKRLEDDKLMTLLHSAIGLAGEAGEFADLVKKVIFQGKNFESLHLKLELGDSCWYIALAVDILKTTFNEILSGNIEKLKKRYPEGFSEEKANNRNINKEKCLFLDE